MNGEQSYDVINADAYSVDELREATFEGQGRLSRPLALALLGVVVAWRCWHEEGHEWPGESGGAGARSRFLAGLGLAHSGLFVLVLAAQWVPTLALHPCL